MTASASIWNLDCFYFTPEERGTIATSMEITRILVCCSLTSSSLSWILQFLLGNVKHSHWLAHTLTLHFCKISKMSLDPLGRVQSLKKHIKLTSRWWEWKCSSRVKKAGFSAYIYTPKMNHLECHWVFYLKSKRTTRALCSLPIISFPIIVVLQHQLM